MASSAVTPTATLYWAVSVVFSFGSWPIYNESFSINTSDIVFNEVVWKLNVPPPSVCKTCPLDPSAVGKV